MINFLNQLFFMTIEKFVSFISKNPKHFVTIVYPYFLLNRKN